MHPDGSWAHNEALELQRALIFEVRKANFYLAKAAGYRVNEPEPYLFSWEQPDPDEGVIKGDAMDVEEAADWLGWTAEMKAHMNP